MSRKFDPPGQKLESPDIKPMVQKKQKAQILFSCTNFISLFSLWMITSWILTVRLKPTFSKNSALSANGVVHPKWVEI